MFVAISNDLVSLFSWPNWLGIEPVKPQSSKRRPRRREESLKAHKNKCRMTMLLFAHTGKIKKLLSNEARNLARRFAALS